MELDLLHIHFNLPLQAWQIPQFRGALSEWVLKYKGNVLSVAEQDLFHNHNNNNASSGNSKFHYRYPLIQYRCVKGKAAIVVLNEAIPVLHKVLMDMKPPFVMRGQTYRLRWEDMQVREHALRMTDKPKTYRLRYWVALNKERTREWEEMRGMSRRIDLLEDALAGHLIAFAIGMDWRIPGRFDVEMLEWKDSRPMRYHKVRFSGFDIVFRVPLDLPVGIGLGKATSHGFGVLQRWGES